MASRSLAPLPIDAVLPELVAALRAQPCAVLRAPTGAGKTTRVPPALLDAGLAGSGAVVMLEPRRVAARAAARRMAEERRVGNEPVELGGEVGFQVRFERRASRATRILVLTEGLLVRRLVDDPLLEGVGVLVFDEFHERNLDTDLALALARRVQLEARPELKLVVMSATIDTAEIARWLGDASVIVSEGRLHPVAIEHLERDDERPLALQVAGGVGRALERTSGDVLASCRAWEIKRTREALGDVAQRRDVALAELYGDLPLEEQDRALRRGPRRRVVLATNVAETSVTVEGVTAVVDSGLARVARYDPGVGLDRLALEGISRASAEQRAGRAGRTAPGLCLRLWTEREQRSRAERGEPEIRRVDLAAPLLQLFAFGESDVRAFPWFEAPTGAAVERALELLTRLGAFDGRGASARGHMLARLPIHPRLGNLLVTAHGFGVLELGALAAAQLQERDPFTRGVRRGAGELGSDVLERALILRDFAESGRAGGELNPGAARFTVKVAEALRTAVERELGREAELEHDEAEAFERAVLAAYVDRLARRREPGAPKGVMVGGRGVVLARESAVTDAELFCCVELDAGKSEALVRQASAVEREWLDPARLREEASCGLDETSGRVVARRRTIFEDLVLDEVETGEVDDALAGRALAEFAARDLPRWLPLDEPETAQFLARVRSLRAWLPELELPAFDETELAALLPEHAFGARSLAELKRRDLAAFLRSKLSFAQQRALDQEAPESLPVPSGSRIRLTYEPGRPPVLAARIQELFGLAASPTVARGRVRVLLHLLAPNHRPQQVTDDLVAPWNGAYHSIKAELRRRYPRHAWPDDPWNATPEKRPKRRGH